MIGVLLVVAGGVTSGLMWRSFSRARKMQAWPLVEGVILDSGIEERRIGPEAAPDFRFELLYSYEWEGEIYECDRYRLRGAGWSSQKGKAQALVEHYPAGKLVGCRLNPDQPSFAVIKVESRAPGYSLWFPMIFVVGGLGVIVGAWRR